MNDAKDQKIYLVAARRLPVCRSSGERLPPEEGGDGVRKRPGRYAGMGSVELLSLVFKDLLATKGVDGAALDDILVGTAIQEGDQGVNIARAAALCTEIPQSVPAATLNRLCGSSLSAAMKGAEFLLAGPRWKDRRPGMVLIGGVEHMGHHDMAKIFEASAFFYEAFAKRNIASLSMGLTAEILAEREFIPREAQEAFAYESHRKAIEAQKAGRFKDELIPVALPDGGTLSLDDGPREYPSREEALKLFSKLKPAFKNGGTVTAATAAPYSDSASGVLLATARAVEERKLEPLAELVSWGSVGLDPNTMGLGPVVATDLVLARSGLRLDQIGLIELNEAFCSQALACIKRLAANHGIAEAELAARINVNGGATAIGHPLGASGAKLLATLAWQMRRTPSVEYGLVTLCIGMGQGDAMILRRP